jgi:hypothetical protein
VEIKTRREKRSDDQALLDHDIDLVSRTHWPVERTDAGTFAAGHRSNVRLVKDGDVIIQCYGSHLWELAWDTPDDSSWMCWDYKPVTVEQIVGLFNFELHPDSLTPFEDKPMHKPRSQPGLFDVAALMTAERSENA